MKDYWNHRENMLVTAIWLFVYAAAPLYMWYGEMVNNFPFRWEEVFPSWKMITVFFILYAIHHFIIIPKLFLKKRYVAYAISVLFCLSAFTAVIVSRQVLPMRPPSNPHPHFQHHNRENGMREKPFHRRHNILAPPDMARLLIALMMLGVDLGSVAWINSIRLRQRLLLLEQQNLKQELEHLRYQINPHFFMNTLNNIHVLVDLDQERAKRAIIELSGLMRHSLYNGSDTVTPLQNEIDFVKQYISLMELRFGNKVKLTSNLPDASTHDIMIPPLIFATFVENAFKHGISYQHPSFIDITIAFDDEKKEVRFQCVNSCWNVANATQDGYHGVGLMNVRKRLDLQYGENYSLDIKKDEQQQFVVNLILPILNTNTTI